MTNTQQIGGLGPLRRKQRSARRDAWHLARINAAADPANRVAAATDYLRVDGGCWPGRFAFHSLTSIVGDIGLAVLIRAVQGSGS